MTTTPEAAGSPLSSSGETQGPIAKEDQDDNAQGEWTELMGEDLQLKVIHVETKEESSTCEVGTPVIVDFVGRQASSREDANVGDGHIFHEETDLLIVVGDKDVIPALEMGIRFLSPGSKGLIYSHSKYAYGTLTRVHGDYELPPNSNVVYQVHVKEIVTGATDVEIASSRKQIANDCYKNEWSHGHGKSRPLYLYRKASDAMNNWLVESPDDEHARSIMVDCLNNMAAVHLRAKEYRKAKEAATRVLVVDPDNVKALCRAARAAMLDPAGSYEESEAAISAAENVKADDPDVIKIRNELERRKKEYKKKTKAVFSKLGVSEKGNEDVRSVDSSKPKSEASTSHAIKTTREETVGSSERGENANQQDSFEPQSWWEVSRPLLLQMAVSFVALFVFQYIAKQKGQGLDSFVKDDMQRQADSSTEF